MSRVIENGQRILLDGQSGEFTIEPSPSDIQRFEQKLRSFEDARNAQRAEVRLPCQTKDGTEVLLLANLAHPSETELGECTKTMGVGLLRTEFLFLDHADPPTMEQQLDLYTQVAACV